MRVLQTPYSALHRIHTFVGSSHISISNQTGAARAARPALRRSLVPKTLSFETGNPAVSRPDTAKRNKFKKLNSHNKLKKLGPGRGKAALNTPMLQHTLKNLGSVRGRRPKYFQIFNILIYIEYIREILMICSYFGNSFGRRGGPKNLRLKLQETRGQISYTRS